MSILTRRNFLRTSAAILAGLVLSDCGSAATGTPFSERKTENVARQPTSVTPEGKESGVSLSIPESLSRFTALLKDGHTFVFPPKSLYLSRDRPQIMLMNIEGAPIVTNASLAIGKSVPIGSRLLEIDGIEVKEYLTTRVLPVICETTLHRRLDLATARLLLGPQGSKVNCRFCTPQGNTIQMELIRNRRADPTDWLRPPQVPDPWEFMLLEQGFCNEAPFSPFEFRVLEGNVAYVALNTFTDPTVVTSFTAKLPTIRQCSGLIFDLRQNPGNRTKLFTVI